MSYTFSDELFSDLHKDAYGFRPGCDGYMTWRMLSDDEKQAKWDRMVQAAEDSFLEEREQQNLVGSYWTGIFWICSSAGIATEVVIEALCRMYDTDDRDFVCWHLGVQYGFLD